MATWPRQCFWWAEIIVVNNNGDVKDYVITNNLVAGDPWLQAQ